MNRLHLVRAGHVTSGLHTSVDDAFADLTRRRFLAGAVAAKSTSPAPGTGATCGKLARVIDVAEQG
jgi:hypothetical protein